MVASLDFSTHRDAELDLTYLLAVPDRTNDDTPSSFNKSLDFGRHSASDRKATPNESGLFGESYATMGESFMGESFATMGESFSYLPPTVEGESALGISTGDFEYSESSNNADADLDYEAVARPTLQRELSLSTVVDDEDDDESTTPAEEVDTGRRKSISV